MALGRDGSLFIADQGNHRIRKIDATTGMITTVAGNHGPGFSGDGGPATEAQLNSPTAIVIDAEGHLSFSDTGNHRVRMVHVKTGIITTIAGHETETFEFDGDSGPATDATLDQPMSLAFDHAGNLYIADRNNHRIRKVDTSTGIISTVAGNGDSVFIGDGGPALQASLRYPSGIAIIGDMLYIADTGHHLIRRVSLTTGKILSMVGGGHPGFHGNGSPATETALNSPHGITLDSEHLYIADSKNNVVRQVTFGAYMTHEQPSPSNRVLAAEP